MTVLFVTQNGYGATRVRILHRFGGRNAGVGFGDCRRHAALTYSRKHYAVAVIAGTNAGKLSLFVKLRLGDGRLYGDGGIHHPVTDIKRKRLCREG